jgi:hypothetical protein
MLLYQVMKKFGVEVALKFTPTLSLLENPYIQMTVNEFLLRVLVKTTVVLSKSIELFALTAKYVGCVNEQKLF